MASLAAAAVTTGEAAIRELTGKSAFVTGGASGIGLGIGRALAQAGVRVMLADIEQGALDAAVASLRAAGGEAHGTLCDVSDPKSVAAAAETAIGAFGKVHILCNNAGVSGRGGIDDISLADWRWVLDVNLNGVLYGIAAFLPHIRGHGEGGHIVNTASVAGMMSFGFSPYAASKFAVVAMSEGLAGELAPHDIGVSVLCPGWVRTRILESTRNRPDRYGQPSAAPPHPLTEFFAEQVRTGMDPNAVARRVLAAIRDNELYIFTHAEMRAPIAERFARILAAYDKWSKL